MRNRSAIDAGFIILTPSGAGKTHYITTAREAGFDPYPAVIDGDDIVGRTIGWPSLHQWWLDPIVGPRQQARTLDVLRLWHEAHPRDLILIAMDHKIVPGDHVCCVVWPTLAAFKRNLAARREQQIKAGKKVGVQPVDPRASYDAGVRLRDWAAAQGIPAVRTVTAALALARPDGHF